MVITSGILQDRWGIDGEIADYFANKRAVPQNNLFWKNKRIYLSAGFGYLTIPLGFDIMFKKGIAKEALLADAHVTLMEEGFDRLKRYEANEISPEEFITQCSILLEGKIKQQKLAADLFSFVSGKTPQYFEFEQNHKALARSDSFLFTLVDLDISDEWVSNFLPYWYSIARPILLLDDFKDLEQDRRTGDENTIIELGNNKEAIEKAYSLGVSDLDLLGEINPLLSAQLKLYLKDALESAPIVKERA
ncbi:MAG: hypothetical protein K2X48_07125 [Chitinophagaceae bacterium]|nr:hypothetical protein [Chitinophagaceae bacterium]